MVLYLYCVSFFRQAGRKNAGALWATRNRTSSASESPIFNRRAATQHLRRCRDVLFRRSIRIPSSRLRLSMALVCLVTIPLGVWAGGLTQVGALLLIFIVILSWEHAAAKQGL
jgi:hypothetical protein